MSKLLLQVAASMLRRAGYPKTADMIERAEDNAADMERLLGERTGLLSTIRRQDVLLDEREQEIETLKAILSLVDPRLASAQEAIDDVRHQFAAKDRTIVDLTSERDCWKRRTEALANDVAASDVTATKLHHRLQDIHRALGGQPGEHPVAVAERVAAAVRGWTHGRHGELGAVAASLPSGRRVGAA